MSPFVISIKQYSDLSEKYVPPIILTSITLLVNAPSLLCFNGLIIFTDSTKVAV
jgi:hypothetical protein